jgi:hypothetical protein
MSNGNGSGVHLPHRRRKSRHTAQIAQNDGEKRKHPERIRVQRFILFFLQFPTEP